MAVPALLTDVKPAEGCHGLFDSSIDSGGIGGVRLNGERLPSSALNFLNDCRGSVGTFRVGNGDVRSVLGQTLCNGGTNATPLQGNYHSSCRVSERTPRT